jgi:hypothetical protein
MATLHRKPKPPTKAARAFGRSLSDFPNLSDAERKLISACRTGDAALLGRKRPTEATEANIIRAELIRFLALGGDGENQVHEKGIQLSGAWIRGGLDLQNCKCPHSLLFKDCIFESKIIAVHAELTALILEGTAISGFLADGLTCKGPLFLRTIKATGPTRLLRASIHGDLSCTGASFENEGLVALACDGMTVKGNVYLDSGEGNVFSAKGEVRLWGSSIGGDLICFGAQFENAKADALVCDGMTVKGSLHLYGSTTGDGAVLLTASSLGQLVDDCSGVAKVLVLDGLTYQRFSGMASTRAEDRIAWLKRQIPQHLAEDFRPQPWEQVIKVLRDMGHPDEARKVAIAKQDALRKAGKIGGPFSNFLHWLYGTLAGYGYRPLSTFGYMIGVWLLCSLIYHFHADSLGVFAPTTPLIHNVESLRNACGQKAGAAETTWTSCLAMPQEYTTFNPFLYSADLILPLVELQQDRDWAPLSTDDNGDGIPLAMFTRALVWFEILFGWAMSLLLVAVLGNLVKKD